MQTGSMKLLPRIKRDDVRRIDARGEDPLNQGLESVVVIVLFLLAGFGIDRWLDTTPVFVLVMFALAAIGLFTKFKYRYEARMAEHEAERSARAAARGHAAPTRVVADTPTEVDQ